MRILQFLTVPKEVEFPNSNEDSFFFHTDGLACALSDGASESYDSKNWSWILCETFTKNARRVNRGTFYKLKEIKNLIKIARTEFEKFYSVKTLSWSQEASFKRGSYATLIGVIDHGTTIEILAIGDTVVIWRDQNSLLNSFFIDINYDFKKKPLLLCNQMKEDTLFFEKLNQQWSYVKIKKNKILNGEIFLLTDAIAQRVLNLSNNGYTTLAINILKKSNIEFYNWVIKERSEGFLKKDDTTVAWINVDAAT
ncbi:MAG: hypothetical protein CBC42_06905 [Betaproteobacteria bacterium TMED82]|nr:MAG: hypothetical protein CBC42_06905 [Betaproteobacteria bacterium TMED82]|tara:strand:- start:15215 stop:15973 length:759 start_codon:yes stop_codon:yes gene_type:complete